MHSFDHKPPKPKKSYFFPTITLLLTLCISITAFIWLHTHTQPNAYSNLQTELSEHLGQLHAKMAVQQRELWELRAKIHNLEKALQDRLNTTH